MRFLRRIELARRNLFLTMENRISDIKVTSLKDAKFVKTKEITFIHNDKPRRWEMADFPDAVFE